VDDTRHAVMCCMYTVLLFNFISSFTLTNRAK